ncbi:MAG: MOSC domain-containing protein [Pseudomonadota bacterium]
MITYQGRIEALCLGPEDILGKQPRQSLYFALDGIADDRHAGFERDTWDEGDKQPAGIRRRNERLWSAVSTEELAQMTEDMGLASPLTASALGANIEISGVPEFSRLTKGSILALPSGAELIVEEYNPPCRHMGESIAEAFKAQNGTTPTAAGFLKAAQLTRGIVGVVDVAGEIQVGDAVKVTLYQPPKILMHSALQV